MIILSAERKELTREENRDRTFELRNALYIDENQFTVGKGCYEGHVETSFLIKADAKDIHNFCLCGQVYNQDTILFVDDLFGGLNNAYLVNVKTEACKYIGDYTEVSETEAKASVAWTFVGGKYYICK
jgi:hypothetical protein